VSPLELFLTFLRDSAFSLGGQTALPLLRQDLVVSGVVTDPQLVEALAIGRLGTGPGGLYMVSLGYYALGWIGAALALVACTLPPLVIVPAAALLRRQLLSTWFSGVVRGLALTTSGLVLTTTAVLLLPAGDQLLLWQIALVVVGALAAIEGKRHPALVIAVGAIAGLALGR
jgi:chromate transporter